MKACSSKCWISAARGHPILLLPGLGATAHSYDELAPLLAKKHRVVAMTRRGTGNSSKPDFGFDTPRLAQDVLQVMDAMKPREGAARRSFHRGR